MKWEIFIPPQDEKSMQTTLTVEAGNWLSALTSGLKQVGEQGEVASNLLCDVRGDGSLHVTDYKTRRVFQIRCLDTSPTGSLLPPPQEKSFLESKSAGRASALPPRLEPVEESYFYSLTGRYETLEHAIAAGAQRIHAPPTETRDS